MTRVTRCLGVLSFIAVVWPSLAPGAEVDKATEAFNALYGQDVTRVKATRDAGDDLELATRLLAAARKATNQPAFLAILCEKACDLASAHRQGHTKAVEAMELLAGEVPDRAAACADKVVEIRQNQFNESRGEERAKAGEALIDVLLDLVDGKLDAGDPTGAATLCLRARRVARVIKSEKATAIDARLAKMANAMRAGREAEQLKARLQKDPNDAATREKLVRLYVVDLDNPAVALEYVSGVADESLRKYVPAAVKGVEATPELACKELGEWYRGLAGEAPPAAKAAMYTRAQAYYKRFLEIHTAADLSRTQVSLALGKVTAALEKLDDASQGGQWTDLLKLVDLKKDVVKGTWRRQGDALALVSRDLKQRVAVPVTVAGDYELQITFVRTSGDDTVAVIFPVGSRRARLALDFDHGKKSGLIRVNGKWLSGGNETEVRPSPLQNGRDYSVHIKVNVQDDKANVAVNVAGKPFIAWRGAPSALASPDWTLPQSASIGMGTKASTAVFRRARLKKLSGEMKLLRPKGSR